VLAYSSAGITAGLAAPSESCQADGFKSWLLGLPREHQSVRKSQPKVCAYQGGLAARGYRLSSGTCACSTASPLPRMQRRPSDAAQQRWHTLQRSHCGSDLRTRPSGTEHAGARLPRSAGPPPGLRRTSLSTRRAALWSRPGLGSRSGPAQSAAPAALGTPQAAVGPACRRVAAGVR
jgi:hypothetical protein